ncbi:phage tail tip fiber protein [Rahnella sp. PCH160]|uniref:phage tail tip fiber protein n=1 Tax=Rahnella sp. PCH160 TaxID=3447928 RepID=UPI0039FC1BCF
MQSQVLFTADRFAILPGSTGSASSAVAPFIVDGGQVIMNSAVIKDGFITNAMIGAFVQSNNYDGSTQGWQLNKSGTFINLGNAGGAGAMKQTNTTISAKDDNSVLRVQVGLITGVW